MLCVDIGNTTVMAALWDGAAFVDRFVQPTHEAPHPHGLCAWARSTGAAHAAIASVAPERTAAVCALLRQGGVEARELRFPEHPFLAHRLMTPQTTGIDRLCAARAAWERGRCPCVVVDAGTAVTVDLVDEGAVFAGGAILPGPGMWLRALFDTASQLPPVEWLGGDRVPACGNGTVAALRAGVAYGLAGAIERLVGEHAAAVGRNLPVWLTGGAGESLRPYLRIETVLVRDLVLEGLCLAAQEHLFPAS